MATLPMDVITTSKQALKPDVRLSGPGYCYIEFEAGDEKSMRRLKEFFEMVRAAKESDGPAHESQLSAFLTDGERSYFSNFTPEQAAEWSEYWFSTPLPQRNSADMLRPQWDFGSMLDAFWNGDYDLIAIRQRSTRHVLEFNPHGYPYGGSDSFVALVECFGHQVVGVDDGTGYEKYVPRTNFWKPSSGPGA